MQTNYSSCRRSRLHTTSWPVSSVQAREPKLFQLGCVDRDGSAPEDLPPSLRPWLWRHYPWWSTMWSCGNGLSLFPCPPPPPHHDGPLDGGGISTPIYCALEVLPQPPRDGFNGAVPDGPQLAAAEMPFPLFYGVSLMVHSTGRIFSTARNCY